MPARRVYWDTSIFISYLSSANALEKERADIAEDVLKHARSDGLEIWTSVWTMVEVIRPNNGNAEKIVLPQWADLLNSKDKEGKTIYPKAAAQLAHVWDYYQRHTQPKRLIPEADAQRIRAMFDWPWLKLIDVVPAIATRAIEISRLTI